MSGKRLLLGIDIGTTGAKALLMEEAGLVLGEVVTEYPLFTPRPGWSEQEPSDWCSAAVRSIRGVLERSKVLPERIAGIGLTGQMHGLVLLSKQGEALRRCILWNDQRTAQECEEVTERIGPERLIRITGKPALTGFTAGKVLWVRKHEKDLFRQAATFLLPKDYVRHRLTGTLGSEVTDTSGTNLFDVGQRRWSEEVAELLEIPRSLLPMVHESAAVCGKVSPEAARETGLVCGTPVVAGAGDQAAQAVGTGIVGPEVISVTIGTSGVVFATTEHYTPVPEGALHAYCHAAPNLWHVMGVTLSAGGSLRWFRDTLCLEEKARAGAQGKDPYDLILEGARGVPPGCEGLLFLPYLSGERTPHPDPYARGVFFGLSLKHTKAHLARAVLEGVTFSLKECLDLLGEAGISYRKIRVSGGGSRSAFWRQMMADVFGKEVVEVNVTQGACFGAALLAGVGAGIYRDVGEACSRTIREVGVTGPGPDQGAYGRVFERYQELYPAVKTEFRKIAQGDADGKGQRDVG